MEGVFNNMTEEQIAEVLAVVKEQRLLALKASQKYSDHKALAVSACGWEQLCENLGIEGYEFS